MIDDLEELIKSAVVEVFSTMLKLPVQAEPANSPVMPADSTIAGAVGFVGQVTGVIYIYTPGDFAIKLAARFLDLDESEVDGGEMVNDCIGELSNMVVGHVKSRLSDGGLSCVMTIPSIVRGTHFCVEPTSSTQRRVFSFRSGESQVVFEVLLKPVEKPVAPVLVTN